MMAALSLAAVPADPPVPLVVTYDCFVREQWQETSRGERPWYTSPGTNWRYLITLEHSRPGSLTIESDKDFAGINGKYPVWIDGIMATSPAMLRSREGEIYGLSVNMTVPISMVPATVSMTAASMGKDDEEQTKEVTKLVCKNPGSERKN